MIAASEYRPDRSPLVAPGQIDHHQVVEPALSSVQGAILMALERCGRTIEPALVQRLGETSRMVGAGVQPD